MGQAKDAVISQTLRALERFPEFLRNFYHLLSKNLYLESIIWPINYIIKEINHDLLFTILPEQ